MSSHPPKPTKLLTGAEIRTWYNHGDPGPSLGKERLEALVALADEAERLRRSVAARALLTRQHRASNKAGMKVVATWDEWRYGHDDSSGDVGAARHEAAVNELADSLYRYDDGDEGESPI